MKNHLLVVLLAAVFSTATSANARSASHFPVRHTNWQSRGDANAQCNLGAMYWDGEGVIEDEREAYIWWSIAKANGCELVADLLRKINWGGVPG